MTGAGGGALTGKSAAVAEVIIAKAATEPNITRIVPSIAGLIVHRPSEVPQRSTSVAATRPRKELMAGGVIWVKDSLNSGISIPPANTMAPQPTSAPLLEVKQRLHDTRLFL
jgi:hypothetical protein